MKNLNVVLDDADFRVLRAAKARLEKDRGRALTWREFLLALARAGA